MSTRRWRLGRTVLMLAGLGAVALGAQRPPAPGLPVLEAHTFEATFDDGSVGPWSSYPPAQDTAYDPTIWVRPLFEDRTAADRALYREITPTRQRDRRFGVRRLLNLHVDDSSVLTFRTLVEAAHGTSGVDVRFGFADGTDRTVRIGVPDVGRWTKARVVLADVLGAGERKKLDAVAFLAVCPDASPTSLHRLGLDDVRLNGRRPVEWTIVSPTAHRLEELRTFVAGRHFAEGDRIAIRARSPVGAVSAHLEARRALTSESSRTVELRGGGRDWSATLGAAGDVGLGPGLWRVTLRAATADGHQIESSLVLLVRRDDAPTGHPRLFMAREDRARLAARTQSGHLADVWAEIQARAAEARSAHHWSEFQYNLDAYDAVHWLPTYNGYVTALGTPVRYIRDNAVVYALSGDPEAGEAARQALLQMARWPTYVHPHILSQGQFTYWPVGLALIDLAVGFDLVHDRLTKPERDTIGRALIAKGVLPVAREYVEQNRVSSNTSNWISHVTGGGILSALSVLDEVGAEAVEPYLTGMILKLGAFIDATFDADGSYGEGYSYANFTMQTLGEIVPALDRTFGVRFPESLGRAHRFLLYQMDTARLRVLDFGDTNDHFYGGLPTFTNFADSLARWRDPHLGWLYGRAPGRTDRDLFFADLDVPSEPPDELPRAVLFRDVGTAIFRSGFQADDFAFVFRAGPFYNHQHFDQGSFFLADRGEDLIVEVGKTDYYADPWYQPLAIQAGGHNTILIDGDPESQRAGDFRHDVPAWQDAAGITDFLTWEDGAFVSSRLGPLYGSDVQRVDRSALWLAPRTMLLIDEVEGGPETSAANIRFHAPRRDDIEVSAGGLRVVRPAATLRVQTLRPADASWGVAQRPLTLAEFATEDALTMKARGYAQLDAAVDAAGVTVVNVLSTDPALEVSAADTPDAGVLDASIAGERYTINASGGARHITGGVETDALVYAEVGRRRLMLRATIVEDARGRLMSSTRPVSVTLEPDSSIRISAPGPTELHLRIDRRPTEVTLDGSSAEGWTYREDEGLVLELGAGEHTLRCR